jgi:hypothetical protein
LVVGVVGDERNVICKQYKPIKIIRAYGISMLCPLASKNSRMSSMKIIYSSGPVIEPWATPERIARSADRKSPNFADLCIFVSRQFMMWTI